MRLPAGALGVLAAAVMIGCGAGGPASAPDPAATSTAPGSSAPARTGTTAAAPPSGSSQGAATSTASDCVNGTCTVRVTCNGTVRTRRGPGPVATRSSSVNGRTAVTLDFAGHAHDAVVRC